MAIRLKNTKSERVFITRAHTPQWLPGDNIYNDAIFVPADMQPGEYDVQLALLDPLTHQPKVLLAIEGKDAEGWYALGKIKIQ